MKTADEREFSGECDKSGDQRNDPVFHLGCIGEESS